MINPLGNLVVLAPHQKPPSSPIFVVGRYKKPTQLWRVLHAGPGQRNKNGILIPIEVAVGDIVLTDEIPNTRHTFSDGVVVMDAAELKAKFGNFQP